MLSPGWLSAVWYSHIAGHGSLLQLLVSNSGTSKTLPIFLEPFSTHTAMLLFTFSTVFNVKYSALYYKAGFVLGDSAQL